MTGDWKSDTSVTLLSPSNVYWYRLCSINLENNVQRLNTLMGDVHRTAILCNYYGYPGRNLDSLNPLLKDILIANCNTKYSKFFHQREWNNMVLAYLNCVIDHSQKYNDIQQRVQIILEHYYWMIDPKCPHN